MGKRKAVSVLRAVKPPPKEKKVQKKGNTPNTSTPKSTVKKIPFVNNERKETTPAKKEAKKHEQPLKKQSLKKQEQAAAKKQNQPLENPAQQKQAQPEQKKQAKKPEQPVKKEQLVQKQAQPVKGDESIEEVPKVSNKKRKKKAKAAADSDSKVAVDANKTGKLTKDTNKSQVDEDSELISKFHVLQKRLCQANGDASQEAEIQKEIEALGGLSAYQSASLRGETKGRFDSSSWVLEFLVANAPQLSLPSVARVLDVGAIVEHYPANDPRSAGLPSKLEVTSIDLNPLAPGVVKADFFDFAKTLLRDRKSVV